MHHYKAPPVFRRDTAKVLAKPKNKVRHPDELLPFDDPTDYAKWKTQQLAHERMISEKCEEVAKQKAQLEQLHLDNYRNFKQEVGRGGLCWVRIMGAVV